MVYFPARYEVLFIRQYCSFELCLNVRVFVMCSGDGCVFKSRMRQSLGTNRWVFHVEKVMTSLWKQKIHAHINWGATYLSTNMMIHWIIKAAVYCICRPIVYNLCICLKTYLCCVKKFYFKFNSWLWCFLCTVPKLSEKYWLCNSCIFCLPSKYKPNRFV